MPAPDWNLLLAATVVSASVVFTPGPNNMICSAIGATVGWRRALPFSLGVTFGFPVLLGAMGLGLGNLLLLYPAAQSFVKFAGAAFLLYLAWRIATAAPPSDRARGGRSPGFLRAFFLQWVNPKGLSFASGLVVLYIRPEMIAIDLPLLMLMSAFLSFISTMTWALFGVAIGRFLHSPLRHRIFSIAMGLLLGVTAVSIL